jgi:hypothetical protein
MKNKVILLLLMIPLLGSLQPTKGYDTYGIGVDSTDFSVESSEIPNGWYCSLILDNTGYLTYQQKGIVTKEFEDAQVTIQRYTNDYVVGSEFELNVTADTARSHTFTTNVPDATYKFHIKSNTKISATMIVKGRWGAWQTDMQSYKDIRNSLEDQVQLDATKLGVQDGDSFNFKVSRLSGDIKEAINEGETMTLNQGDTFELEITDATITTNDEIKTTTIMGDDSEIEMNVLDEWNNYVIYNHWEYWENLPETNYAAFKESDVVISSDSGSFGVVETLSSDLTGAVTHLDVLQKAVYEKSNGVLQTFHTKMERTWENGTVSLDEFLVERGGGGDSMIPAFRFFEIIITLFIVTTPVVLKRKRN